jgi:hypothetical protein
VGADISCAMMRTSQRRGGRGRQSAGPELALLLVGLVGVFVLGVVLSSHVQLLDDVRREAPEHKLKKKPALTKAVLAVCG